MFRSIVIAGLLGSVIGGSLWSVFDTFRPQFEPAELPSAPIPAGVNEGAKLERAMTKCFDRQQALESQAFELRTAVINAKVRLAQASRPIEAHPAPPVSWESLAEDRTRYRTFLDEVLDEHEIGQVLMSSCDEFPCIWAIEAAVDELEDQVQERADEDLFVHRVGIAEHGRSLHYVAIAAKSSPEFRVGHDPLITRIEYRSLLIDSALREEQAR